MLQGIAPYLTHFTEAISIVTGVDIEVIDSRRIRVAGTGIYAASVGERIEGEIYKHALTHRESVFVDDPMVNPICQSCKYVNNCEEKLTFCTPIVASGRIIGIFGLVCFTDADRERIIASRDTYVYFFRQIADGVARVIENEQTTNKIRQRMDMLLKVTNSGASCVMVLDKNNRVSFMNDAARRELSLSHEEPSPEADVAPTGDKYSDLDEFEVAIAPLGQTAAAPRHTVLGHLTTLSRDDELFHRALVFDSKLRIAQMLSRMGNPSENADVFSTIVGAGPVITTLKEQVLKIAETSSTVLITGESGTGKEMFARAIHAASNRKDKPFIAINCGAIPDALLENELFGYVSGAFTGASPSGRMGKFELADQGVLFLDEISSMPLYLQVKLLRVLQDRSFTRLGSNKNVNVDIRVIAATNVPLPDLISQRLFREDLYYRLNVIPLDIPPLRKRKEDIPTLATFFLDRYSRLFGKPGTGLSDELLERLVDYDWPGNVREFENCIEYMVNMHGEGRLSVECLPAKIKLEYGKPPAAKLKPAYISTGGTIVPLAQLEHEAINAALKIYGTSSEGKRQAAVALGISTATLYRKLKQDDRSRK